MVLPESLNGPSDKLGSSDRRTRPPMPPMDPPSLGELPHGPDAVLRGLNAVVPPKAPLPPKPLSPMPHPSNHPGAGL